MMRRLLVGDGHISFSNVAVGYNGPATNRFKDALNANYI